MITQRSILLSVKDYLGVDPDDTTYDEDIISYINMALLRVKQISVAVPRLFTINGDLEVWSDITDDQNCLVPIEQYVKFKVKKMFIQTTSKTLSDAMDSILKEIEFALIEAGENEELYDTELLEEDYDDYEDYEDITDD